jgi:hypothetical protein
MLKKKKDAAREEGVLPVTGWHGLSSGYGESGEKLRDKWFGISED